MGQGNEYLPIYCFTTRFISVSLTLLKNFPSVQVFDFITHTLHFVEKLLVVLRDGRTLIGYLRSIDQFGKLFNRYMHL